MPTFTGKGAEILKYIAENEPCTQYTAREKAKRWSSRTVSKQFQRLEREELIRRTVEGYEVTDWGFFSLVPVLRGLESRKILRMAIRKYPGGRAERTFGTFLNQQREKVDLERKVGDYLKEPNILLACRTDVDGRIARIFLMGRAIDPESGRPNFKIQKRLPSKIRARWRTIDLR